MNKLGYKEKEIEHMYLGKWADLYNAYKMCFNIENERQYKIDIPQKIVSVFDL